MPRYTAVAVILHWLTVVLILALIPLGLIMTELGEGFETKQLYQFHKSLGLTVLGLIALRLVWRFGHTPPPLPEHLRAWEKRLATFVHISIYVVLIALPLSGWVRVSSSPLNVQTIWFDFVHLPHIPFLEALSREQKEAFEPYAKGTHYGLAIALIVLLTLHIAGTVKHQLLDRINILQRMWPKGVTSYSVVTLGLILLATGLLTSLAQKPQNTALAIKPGENALTFEIAAGGQNVVGRFKQFDAQISFDPDNLEATNIAVTIDMASVTVGDVQGDAALKSADWFDIKTHPTATFKADRAVKRDDGTYEVTGTLTLRGTSKPISLPFSLTENGKLLKAIGEVTIKRTDYKIGTSVNTGPITVAKDVTVKIDITANRAGN